MPNQAQSGYVSLICERFIGRGPRELPGAVVGKAVRHTDAGVAQEVDVERSPGLEARFQAHRRRLLEVADAAVEAEAEHDAIAPGVADGEAELAAARREVRAIRRPGEAVSVHHV